MRSPSLASTRGRWYLPRSSTVVWRTSASSQLAQIVSDAGTPSRPVSISWRPVVGRGRLLDRDEEAAAVAAVDDVQLAAVDPRAGEHVRCDVEHVDHAERVERMEVDQLAAHREQLAGGDVVAGDVEGEHVLVHAHAPDARAAAVLDAPQLDVGGRFRVCDHERVVQRGAQALRVGAHAGRAGRVGDAADERQRTARPRLRPCAALVEDALQHRCEVGPDPRVESDARQRLEREREDLVMRSVGPTGGGSPSGPVQTGDARGPCRIVSLDTLCCLPRWITGNANVAVLDAVQKPTYAARRGLDNRPLSRDSGVFTHPKG